MARSLPLVAWQALARNEWLQSIRGALSAGRDLPSPPLGAPGPFGLADPDGVRAALTAAGYDDIAVDDVEEPFWAGADRDDAFRFISGSAVARGMLQGLDDATRTGALDALRDAMAAHETAEGVLFGSAVWLVSARRR